MRQRSPWKTRRAQASDAPLIAHRFEPGHYYSPVADLREVRNERRRMQVWPSEANDTPGIKWRDDEQLRLCREVFAAQERLHFERSAQADAPVYYTTNRLYPPLDAWILEGLLRHLRPRRMIEIGSGFSSLVSAQVNRDFLNSSLEFACVEPNPQQFLIGGVAGIASMRVDRVQDVELSWYDRLTDGDVLFIDTTHTIKTGGDVPWIYHQVVPRLAPGVLVHIHDIFLPRDYPELWVLEGRGWTEQYLVQSFLQFNDAFDVLFSGRWMLEHHAQDLQQAFPDYPQHEPQGASSLWIRRRGGRPLL